MSQPELRIIAPDRRRHREALIDLISKVFSQEGYFTMRDYSRDAYIGHSHYDWDVSRIGLLDTQVVTHFGVWGYDMRIGTAQVRVGGIGAVATHADYRKRGWMAQTVRASLDAMRAAGYDMTLLFGIDNFYHKFGYTRAWGEHETIVATGDLPAVPPSVHPRQFNLRVRADINALYNQTHPTETGTAVRPTYMKLGFWCHEHTCGYRWREADGNEGYVMLFRRPDRLSCIEAVGNPEEALRVIGKLARQWGYKEVRFSSLPYDSPLMQQIRRGNCREERHYRACGGAMICLLNLPSALEKMAGELSARLQASPLANWRGNLLIDSGREQATLAIADGMVKATTPIDSPHAVHGNDAIVQLLIGTAAPSAVARDGDFQLSGDAALLLEVLFPTQHPMLAFYDRF